MGEAKIRFLNKRSESGPVNSHLHTRNHNCLDAVRDRRIHSEVHLFRPWK